MHRAIETDRTKGANVDMYGIYARMQNMRAYYAGMPNLVNQRFLNILNISYTPEELDLLDNLHNSLVDLEEYEPRHSDNND